MRQAGSLQPTPEGFLNSPGQVPIQERLLDFLRSEFQVEAESRFARLRRVPDSRTKATLRLYSSLCEADRNEFADCCAHWTCANYLPALGIRPIDHTRHAYFQTWNEGLLRATSELESVPLLKLMAKVDKHDLAPGVLTEDQFAYVLSVRPVAKPELRRQVRAALKPLGFTKTFGDEYRCHHAGQDFSVHVDFGGTGAQLRYGVLFPEFGHYEFGFERTLGAGFGDWDFIVEENVDDVFGLFTEVVAYSSQLPARIKNAVKL